ncbi:hypothetical protein IY145_09770 [Methylosinus sp. H3A]|uniref:hypothetical protein n=1 Tax=Methylosinus sp. H3A TaxID=2785786 RepID=UPI0018C30A11|nr:hypothetical protein [Methylosinus sp. H3A]MBG0809664.1 hypothetical protein [Methylosinus sp. H3A]
MTRPQSATFPKAAPAAHSRRDGSDGRISLLRLSAAERLLAAAAVLALLWVGVYWALN